MTGSRTSSREHTRSWVFSGGRTYSEQQIAGFANPDQSVLFDDSSTHALAAPADEVLSYLLPT